MRKRAEEWRQKILGGFGDVLNELAEYAALLEEARDLWEDVAEAYYLSPESEGYKDLSASEASASGELRAIYDEVLRLAGNIDSEIGDRLRGLGLDESVLRPLYVSRVGGGMHWMDSVPGGPIAVEDASAAIRSLRSSLSGAMERHRDLLVQWKEEQLAQWEEEERNA